MIYAWRRKYEKVMGNTLILKDNIRCMKVYAADGKKNQKHALKVCAYI